MNPLDIIFKCEIQNKFKLSVSLGVTLEAKRLIRVTGKTRGGGGGYCGGMLTLS